jgi:hypothetical protein
MGYKIETYMKIIGGLLSGVKRYLFIINCSVHRHQVNWQRASVHQRGFSQYKWVNHENIITAAQGVIP